MRWPLILLSTMLSLSSLASMGCGDSSSTEDASASSAMSAGGVSDTVVEASSTAEDTVDDDRGDVSSSSVGGQRAEAALGPGGGSVALTLPSGQIARLSIAPGVLAEVTDIAIVRYSVASTPLRPMGYALFSHIYFFEPEGLAFSEPVRVELPFNGTGAGLDMYWSDRDQRETFQRLDAVLEDGVASADVDHFSVAFVGEECTPQCDGLACGPDTCGGFCGTCEEGEVCEAGSCEVATSCSFDGDCGEGRRCVRGVCTGADGCQNVCGVAECGPDGCGGSCGTCADGEPCVSGRCGDTEECRSDFDCGVGQRCVQGQCREDDPCDPPCAGRECGIDPCGSACGSCSGSDTCVSGQCQQRAQCVSDTDCGPGQICSGGQCI